ncbi:hypothetical protein T459_12181 [Capsicum annuum]|uniref:Uncharacterized protein n=1 Tax=Capsicum annuum TaxID=4072 RepID=A0A2G2ZP22_CAPAN|nr:hypothetical protein T459_12181 [Capsicum annuum]
MVKVLWQNQSVEGATWEAEAAMRTKYTFNSIESQIRVLGDYAFMLHDYELALSDYHLLSTNYKLDKAWKHYASVQDLPFLNWGSQGTVVFSIAP